MPIKGRILVIDDSRLVADLTREVLESEGYEALTAYDGPSGIELAREAAPEVILCDLSLDGGMNGYEVAKELRQLLTQPYPLLVAVSAYAEEDIRQAMRQSAFDSQLSKPLDISKLERLIANHRAALAHVG